MLFYISFLRYNGQIKSVTFMCKIWYFNTCIFWNGELTQTSFSVFSSYSHLCESSNTWKTVCVSHTGLELPPFSTLCILILHSSAQGHACRKPPLTSSVSAPPSHFLRRASPALHHNHLHWSLFVYCVHLDPAWHHVNECSECILKQYFIGGAVTG